MIRVWKNAAAILLFSSALTAISLGSSEEPASATHFQQRAQAVQFNMWGYKGNTSYNDGVVDAILSSIDARTTKPLAMSFNEVCRQQYSDLVYHLNTIRGLGYSAFQTWTRGQDGTTPVNYGNCVQWGNALFWLGGNTGEFYMGYYANNVAGAEQRNWACAHAAFPEYWACTTHLIANNVPAAQVQARDYLGRINAKRATGLGMIAMGDLNMPPASVPSGFYTNYQEADNVADNPSVKRGTTDGGSKVDYIWRANPASIPHDAYIAPSGASDHHWYQMYL